MVVLVLYCTTIKWRSTMLRVGVAEWRSQGGKVQHYGRLTPMRHCPGPRHAQVAMHNTMAVNPGVRTLSQRQSPDNRNTPSAASV
jgi:hypothetical protein